jgi:hypothetical protein
VISARAGFAVTCDQRLSKIELDVKRTSNGVFTTYRRYTLAYTVSPLTGRSLLQSVTVTGIDGSGNSRSLPPVTFGYLLLTSNPGSGRYDAEDTTFSTGCPRDVQHDAASAS